MGTVSCWWGGGVLEVVCCGDIMLGDVESKCNQFQEKRGQGLYISFTFRTVMRLHQSYPPSTITNAPFQTSMLRPVNIEQKS
jgi:hypothetical protein